ncbi:unnamed protein product [Auanema sp. JU1783]|nr:unnamed protein product [Auanema sp. JU1783]
MNICILFLIHSVNALSLYDAVAGPIIENTLKLRYKTSGPQIREEICEEKDKCYLIYDMLGYIGYEVFGVDLNFSLGYSAVLLKTPQDYNENFYDVSTWMPHKERMSFDPYPFAICDAFFWSGAIPRKANERMYDITIIGLGGGDFSNYYDSHYPHLNITVVELSPTVAYVARKWFNVTESDRYRVKVQEGVSYLEGLRNDGKQMDGVLLDATYNSMNARYVSPVEDFLKYSSLKLLSQVIKRNGVLVSNVVVGKKSSNSKKALLEIVELFQKFFAYVELAEMSSFNSVLIARHEPFLHKRKADLYPKVIPFHYIHI